MIHLLRHGEVANPDHVVYADLPGFVLSELGVRQADEAAQRLASLSIDAVLTSPLERAVETAAAVGKALGVEAKVDERLTEWGLARRWAGVVWEKLPVERPGELEDYLTRPADLELGSESLLEVAQRVAAVAEREARSGSTAVLVSHQDPIQAARLLLRGLPLQSLHQDKPGHATIISLRPGDPWTEEARWETANIGPDFPPLAR